jgi:hypothetical protein
MIFSCDLCKKSLFYSKKKPLLSWISTTHIFYSMLLSWRCKKPYHIGGKGARAGKPCGSGPKSDSHHGYTKLNTGFTFCSF